MDKQDIMLLCNCILLLDELAFDLLILLLSILIRGLNILIAIMKFFSLNIYVLFWKLMINIFMGICFLINLYVMNRMIYHIMYSQVDHYKLKGRRHISFHLPIYLQDLSKEWKFYLLYLLLNYLRNLIKLH